LEFIGLKGKQRLLIEKGKLIVSDQEKKAIVLERKYSIGLGRFIDVLPKVAPSMADFGTVYPNTGAGFSRLKYKIREAGVDELEGRSLVKVGINDALKNIRDGRYDAPTVSGIVKSLLVKGYLEYKG